MEFNQTVMARRSLRAYEEGKTVEKAQIEELIRFAQMAPSWKNSQTGRYYVVMSPEMLEKERKDCLPELNQKISATGYVDLVDMEAFTGDDAVKAVVEEAHKHGVKVVASNHDFDKTPAKSDIIYRLRKMQELVADIPKIAVMPQNKKDVLTLLAATEEMVNNYADRPFIT